MYRDMSAGQLPTYTSKDEPKINLAHQPAESGSLSIGPQGGQASAPPQVPSAPPGYEAIAYYLASSSAGNAPVVLQPQSQQFQQQQQPQVIVVQSPAQMVLVPPVQQHVVSQSFTAHIVLACCSCFCCFACPFSIISFVLARKCTFYSPNIASYNRASKMAHYNVFVNQIVTSFDRFSLVT